MNKEFVPYKESLALKELGFDEPCFGYYSELGSFNFEVNKTNSNCNKPGMHGKYCTAPTYSQTFRWFREKYDLRIWIESNYGIIKFEYVIATTNINFINNQFEDSSYYRIYEEAELECLRKLIEIVKNNE
jgi:hypothetical protein